MIEMNSLESNFPPEKKGCLDIEDQFFLFVCVFLFS